MKKHVAALCAVAMAFSFTGTTTAPAIAGPAFQVPTATPAETKLVTEVDHRRRHFRHHRLHRGKFRHRHRNYRHRRSNDTGAAIIGGLAAGIVGGIIASQTTRSAPVYGNAHVDWCLNRYRSYDVRTDTFQPYHGPRKRCRSPYR